MKSLLLLSALFATLQCRLWFGEGSLRELWTLDRRIALQQTKNAALTERNAQLAREVRALQSGGDVVEAYARENLDMIRKDEVFYQFVDES